MFLPPRKPRKKDDSHFIGIATNGFRRTLIVPPERDKEEFFNLCQATYGKENVTLIAGRAEARNWMKTNKIPVGSAAGISLGQRRQKPNFRPTPGKEIN